MKGRGRYVLNQHHEPMQVEDLMLWAAWLEEDETRIVKQETVTGLGELVSPFAHPFVSTVFLGLDYNFREKGPPILFETMVLRGGPFKHTMWRYATWDEALKGHEYAVDMVQDPRAVYRQIKDTIKRWWRNRT